MKISKNKLKLIVRSLLKESLVRKGEYSAEFKDLVSKELYKLFNTHKDLIKIRPSSVYAVILGDHSFHDKLYDVDSDKAFDLYNSLSDLAHDSLVTSGIGYEEDFVEEHRYILLQAVIDYLCVNTLGVIVRFEDIENLGLGRKFVSDDSSESDKLYGKNSQFIHTAGYELFPKYKKLEDNLRLEINIDGSIDMLKNTSPYIKHDMGKRYSVNNDAIHEIIRRFIKRDVPEIIDYVLNSYGYKFNGRISKLYWEHLGERDYNGRTKSDLLDIEFQIPSKDLEEFKHKVEGHMHYDTGLAEAMVDVIEDIITPLIAAARSSDNKKSQS